MFSLCSFLKKKVTANLRQKLLLEALKEEAKANKAPVNQHRLNQQLPRGKALV